jgi:hypothetical protein
MFYSWEQLPGSWPSTRFARFYQPQSMTLILDIKHTHRCQRPIAIAIAITVLLQQHCSVALAPVPQCHCNRSPPSPLPRFNVSTPLLLQLPLPLLLPQCPCIMKDLEYLLEILHGGAAAAIAVALDDEEKQQNKRKIAPILFTDAAGFLSASESSATTSEDLSASLIIGLNFGN